MISELQKVFRDYKPSDIDFTEENKRKTEEVKRILEMINTSKINIMDVHKRKLC